MGVQLLFGSFNMHRRVQHLQSSFERMERSSNHLELMSALRGPFLFCHALCFTAILHCVCIEVWAVSALDALLRDRACTADSS